MEEKGGVVNRGSDSKTIEVGEEGGDYLFKPSFNQVLHESFESEVVLIGRA